MQQAANEGLLALSLEFLDLWKSERIKYFKKGIGLKTDQNDQIYFSSPLGTRAGKHC